MVRLTLIFALWWSTDVSLSGNWGAWVPNSAYGIKGQNSLINCTFWYPKEQTLKLRKWLLSTKNEVIVVAPSEGNSLDRYIIIGEGEKRQCTLLISNTTLEDEEIYKFRFETDKDKWSAKDKTKLYISAVPTFVILSQPGYLYSGIETNLSCSTSNVYPLEYSEMHHCRDLLNGSVVTSQKTEVDKTITINSIITFIPKPSYHQKNCTCTVTHKNLTQPLRSSVTLYVMAIPKTLKIWVPDQINAGTNISLNCSVANIFPKNSVQMLFSTDVLKGSEISFSGENENGTFTLTTTLLFTPQPLHHQKVFTCKVIHTDLNKTLHTNITIDVKYPPKIKSLYSCLPSTEEYCRICESEANPAANITWNIINGDKEETLKGDDLQINGVRSNGTIRLKSVHGTVYCVATNIYGSDKWSIDNGSKQDSHIVGVIVPAATIAVLLFVSLLVYVICKVHMSKRKTCQPHGQTAHISQRMEEQATDITYMQVRKMVQNNCDQQENSVQDVMYAVVSVTNGYIKKDLHAPNECNTLPIYANVEFPKTNEEKPKVLLAPEMTEYASVLFTKQ